MSPLLLGPAFGLASALVWGTGDFIGGLASRRAGQFQVVALAAFAGLVLLLPAVALLGEPALSAADIAWSVGAGSAGAGGIAALYAGLSRGRAAVVAPTAAVVSAVLPLLISLAREGAPSTSRLVGLVAGLVGIWLVSRPAEAGARPAAGSGFRLGLLAGVGFAGYFVLIAEVESGLVAGPLLVTKIAGLAVAATVLRWRRQAFPSPRVHPLGVVTGVLDLGGNVFYMLAVQNTSLAVAAVLASMYPAATVGLSTAFLGERLARAQVIGVGICLLSVGLIAG